MLDRERELMAENGELKAAMATLKQGIADREAYYRDLRDIYGMGEEDIGANAIFADTAPMKSAGNK